MPPRKSKRVIAAKESETKAASSRKRAKVQKNSDVEEEEEEKNSVSFHTTLGLDKEKKLAKKGYKFICGVDEAGRGPLAGPVCAAACIVPLDCKIQGIFDSKQLTEEQREELYEKLMNDDTVIKATCLLDAERVDEINILQATMEAMTKAVEELPVKADYAIIDGNRIPKQLKIESESVIKGDSKIFSIGAASILAKVTRDRLMLKYDKEYPEYGFADHKGYGTAKHMNAIHKHGPTPIHRWTFAPLKNTEEGLKRKEEREKKAKQKTDKGQQTLFGMFNKKKK